MKSVLWMVAGCAVALGLSGCGNQGGSSSGGGYQQAGTGPFDSRGNYVEEWADNPSQWRKGGGGPASKPSRSVQTPVVEPEEPPTIAANDEPPADSIPLAPNPPPVVSANTKPQPTVERPSRDTSTSTTVKAETKPKPKAKPKPVVAAKKKPATKRYVIKKGDTLSTIASRNGTSVSALRKANGISGSLIQPGKSLVIPKS